MKKLIVLAFWLLVWQLLSMWAGSSLLLPGPAGTGRALAALVVTKAFYMDTAATFLRCAAGILLSFVLGTATAVLSGVSSYVRAILSLPVSFLKAVPVMAIIIYGLLLLTSGNVPVMACFLMCYPIVYTNTLSGLDHMDRQLPEMAKLYAFSAGERIRYIYISSLAPELAAALSLVAGLSWKSVVAAEILSVPLHSMGYELLNAKIYMETDSLFAWVIAIVAISVCFEKCIRRLVKKMEEWHVDGSRLRRGRGAQAAGSAAGRRRRRRTAAGMPRGNTRQKAGSQTDEPDAGKPQTHSRETAAPALGLSHVSKRFEEKSVLNDMTISFEAGRGTAVMGPSGIGKTTVLRILAGLEKPDSGMVCGAGRTAFLFQEDRLLPWLSVWDNVMLVCRDGALTAALLDAVELGADHSRLPGALSGGMKHRVAIARALAFACADSGDPAVIVPILMDEPFRGLDEALKWRIAERIRPYLAGHTLVLVTHDAALARQLADRIVQV